LVAQREVRADAEAEVRRERDLDVELLAELERHLGVAGRERDELRGRGREGRRRKWVSDAFEIGGNRTRSRSVVQSIGVARRRRRAPWTSSA